jgi:hypothetical protein
MTVDVDAQELKVGDKVLVEMKVRKIIQLNDGNLGVLLEHAVSDYIEDVVVRTYHKTQSVEIHTP